MNRIFVVLLISMSSLMSLMHTFVHASEPGMYTFGVVPQFSSRQTLSIWDPLIIELEKRTGLQFRLKGSKSIANFESSFMTGGFDFAYMNPYQVLKANKSQGYNPLVRDIKRKLHGVLVVRKDSPIQELKDLNGKRIAFPAPNALGASLIIRADLNKIHNISIEPLYVHTHSSVYLNVLMGQVDAGGGVQKTLAKQPGEISNNLRVIYTTREIIPHPIAAHSRVPPEVQESVRKAFLEIGETEEGRNLLNAVPILAIGNTSIKDYQPMAEWGLDEFYKKN